MKTIPHPDAALWLLDFDPVPDNFDWDEGNEGKNLKHGVTADEIESILAQVDCVFWGRIIDPAHANGADSFWDTQAPDGPWR